MHGWRLLARDQARRIAANKESSVNTARDLAKRSREMYKQRSRPEFLFQVSVLWNSARTPKSY